MKHAIELETIPHVETDVRSKPHHIYVYRETERYSNSLRSIGIRVIDFEFIRYIYILLDFISCYCCSCCLLLLLRAPTCRESIRRDSPRSGGHEHECILYGILYLHSVVRGQWKKEQHADWLAGFLYYIIEYICFWSFLSPHQLYIFSIILYT